MGGLTSHPTEQIWEKTVNPGVLVFLTDFELVGTHAVPNACECTNLYNMEMFCRKSYHSWVSEENSRNSHSILRECHKKNYSLPTL